MFIVLVSFIIGLFVALLFVNLYFRIRVFKLYGILVRAKVQFEAKHIFNNQLMEKEVIPKHPAMTNEIRDFTKHLRNSIKMASYLVITITLFGAVLMYFRE